MSVNQIRRNGSYAPLSAHYYKDDALAEAGPLAELLFCRSLAFCADILNDGFVSDIQFTRFVAVGIPNARRHLDKLAAVNDSPVTLVDGGYVIRTWLKWNKSAAEIREKQKADAQRKSGGNK